MNESHTSGSDVSDWLTYDRIRGLQAIKDNQVLLILGCEGGSELVTNRAYPNVPDLRLPKKYIQTGNYITAASNSEVNVYWAELTPAGEEALAAIDLQKRNPLLAAIAQIRDLNEFLKTINSGIDKPIGAITTATDELDSILNKLPRTDDER